MPKLPLISFSRKNRFVYIFSICILVIALVVFSTCFIINNKSRKNAAVIAPPKHASRHADEVVDTVANQRVLVKQQLSVDLSGKAKELNVGGKNVSINLSNSRPLPNWLVYEPVTMLLTGTPDSDDIGVYEFVIRTAGADRDYVDNFTLYVNPAKFSEIKPEILDTALLDLPLRRINLNGLSSNIWQNWGAMGVLGERMLISDSASKSQFFQLDLRGGAISLTKLPLTINTFSDEMDKTFKAGKYWGIPMAHIQDILFLNEGKKIAVSYGHWDVNKECMTLRVATLSMPSDWNKATNDNWEPIFVSTPCMPFNADFPNIAAYQAGGRMIERRPGTLTLTVGDFGKDIYPQNLATDYGKILEIATKCCKKRIVSIGNRNMQGLFEAKDGVLWSTEHGPRGGDELNIIKKGQNYGWPFVTYGVNYDRKSFGNQKVAGQHEKYVKPVYAWVPSLGIGSLIQVKGFSREWEGDLLVASLKGQQLRRLRIADRRVVYDEPIPLKARLRDIGQLSDGRIAVLTDDGQMLVFSPTQHPDSAAVVDSYVSSLSGKAKAVFQRCLECHSVTPGIADIENRVNLANVFGRRIAGAAEFKYSDALSGKAGSWDEKTLNDFISSPQTFAPGTAMPIDGVKDPSVRNELVELIKKLRSVPVVSPP